MKWILPVVLLALFSGQAVAQRPIDVHSHILTPEYTDFLKAHGAELEDGYPLPEWSAEKHVRFMDEAGIEWAVLTLPSPQPWFGDTDESRRLIRSVNRAAAEARAQYPDRFRFCAALPLPDVEAAIGEAIYALDTLRADGIKLASNSRGQYLGDATLDPLMEALDAREAVVIIHPHRPAPQQENVFSGGPIFVYEYPAETTRAVINLIVNNVPVRYPNIRFVVPHGGSFLPIAIPRLRAAMPLLVGKGLAEAVDIDANLAHLWYDLAGGPSAEVIKLLLTITSPDQILYGSDYGFVPDGVLTGVLQRLRTALASDPQLAPHTALFLRENAQRLFEK